MPTDGDRAPSGWDSPFCSSHSSERVRGSRSGAATRSRGRPLCTCRFRAVSGTDGQRGDGRWPPWRRLVSPRMSREPTDMLGLLRAFLLVVAGVVELSSNLVIGGFVIVL